MPKSKLSDKQVEQVALEVTKKNEPTRNEETPINLFLFMAQKGLVDVDSVAEKLEPPCLNFDEIRDAWTAKEDDIFV